MNCIKSILILFALASATAGFAEAPAASCPIVLKHVEVSYRHDGGESNPQLRLSFQNQAGKQVSNVVFRLLILDSGGYGQEYSREFVYTDVLAPGKDTIATWALDPGVIDMHRTGASALVSKLTYADDSNWADDGSESCSVTMDYHPR